LVNISFKQKYLCKICSVYTNTL